MNAILVVCKSACKSLATLVAQCLCPVLLQFFSPHSVDDLTKLWLMILMTHVRTGVVFLVLAIMAAHEGPAMKDNLVMSSVVIVFGSMVLSRILAAASHWALKKVQWSRKMPRDLAKPLATWARQLAQDKLLLHHGLSCTLGAKR